MPQLLSIARLESTTTSLTLLLRVLTVRKANIVQELPLRLHLTVLLAPTQRLDRQLVLTVLLATIALTKAIRKVNFLTGFVSLECIAKMEATDFQCTQT